MKKKVLVVVKTLSLGGVGSVIFSYYSALSDSNVQMDFATGDPIEEKYRRSIDKGNSHLYILKDRDKKIFSYIFTLAKIVKNGKYDIVHIHGNSALILPELLASFLGGAKVRIAHSHNTTCDHITLERFIRPFFHMLCNERLACSELAGKWMFQHRKFKVVNNAIDLNQYIYSDEKRQSVRLSLGIEKDFVLGHVGNFNYQKNHEFLIEIFKNIHSLNNNTKLLLVGVGDNYSLIQKKVIDYELQDSVIFYGVSDNVPELMMAMDVFVLPSHFEGLPCVLIEAQALGLPCVISTEVSSEAKMSESFEFCSLESTFEEWTNKIMGFMVDRRINSLINKQEMINRGYDIKNGTKLLMDIYGVES